VSNRRYINESTFRPDDYLRSQYNYQETDLTAQSAFNIQYGGKHYKTKKIQPVEYILANGIGFCEGSAIKYLTRWKDKGGIEDLKKAKHYIEMLIEQETKKNEVS
jgi:hypothetical protein